MSQTLTYFLYYVSYLEIVHTHEISISFANCEVSSLATLLGERFALIAIDRFFGVSSGDLDITTLYEVMDLL